MGGARVEEVGRPIRKLLKKNPCHKCWLRSKKVTKFGHILMVKMRRFIQRFDVECQRKEKLKMLVMFGLKTRRMVIICY